VDRCGSEVFAQAILIFSHCDHTQAPSGRRPPYQGRIEVEGCEVGWAGLRREVVFQDLHSAGPAHNLERIFYAILRQKTGRSEIVATTSVGDAVPASNSRRQSDVRADRRLYAPFNGHEPNSLAEGAQCDSTPRTRRLERFPVHPLLVDREGPRQLALQRATVLASSERISHYE
jgi:hypothetical protein